MILGLGNLWNWRTKEADPLNELTENIRDILPDVNIDLGDTYKEYDGPENSNENLPIVEKTEFDYAEYGKKIANAFVTTSVFGLFTTLIATRSVCNVSIAILRETLLGISNTCSAYTQSNKKSEPNALKATIELLYFASKGAANLTDLLHKYTVDLALKKLINELVEPYLTNKLKFEGAEKDSYSEQYNNYIEKGLKVLDKTPDALNKIVENAGLTYKSCLALPEASKAKAQ